MVANILPADPYPLPPGTCRSKSTFSEQNHVADQIKGNQECSSMVANKFPSIPSNAYPPPPQTWEWGNSLKLKFLRAYSCCISNKRESRIEAAWVQLCRP